MCNIQRYAIYGVAYPTEDPFICEAETQVDEDDEGKWCKYEDVKKENERLLDIIEKYREASGLSSVKTY